MYEYMGGAAGKAGCAPRKPPQEPQHCAGEDAGFPEMTTIAVLQYQGL